MKAYEFLDNVLKEVKYKPRHKEIRDELLSHIDELTEQCKNFCSDNAEDMAVGQMGNAKELGKKINNQYRMPFNCVYGIAIWTFINTVLMFLLYPIWIYIYKLYTTKAIYAAMIPAAYALLNILYLKRGHFRCSFRDWRDILIGTSVGTAVSIGGLYLLSYFFKFGYYPYGAMCKIPVKLLPTSHEISVFLFAFWVLWMIYMLSLGKPKKSKDGIFLYKYSSDGVFIPGHMGKINIDDSDNV